MATQANGRSKLRFSIFEVDLAAGEMCKRGVPLPVQEKPFQILALLLERPGEVVTREELQKRLWPTGTFVDFDKGLNTAIKKLRQVLGDSADTPVFIETLPRKGYRFIAPIHSNGMDFAQHVSSIPQSPRDISPPKILHGYRAIAVGVSIAMGIFVAWVIAHRKIDDGRPFELHNAQVTKLTRNGRIREIAISPDGKYVAYAVWDGPGQNLLIREIRGESELQLLPSDTVNFSGLEFSPDGNFIYFIRSEKTNPTFSYLCKIPARGGNVQQLIRDADSPVSFSPDGKRFVYTRGRPNVTEIRTARADGSDDQLLVSMDGHEVYEAGAAWSPKGDVIAVPLHIIGQQSRFVVYTIAREGRATELFSSQGAIGRPLWVNSGRELVITLEDLNSHRGQLWKISYPDGRGTRLTNDLSDYSSAIDMSKNGAILATIVSTTISNLWIAPANDLSRPYQITSGEPSLFQVRELNDHRLLALGNGVWTMNGDGTNRAAFAQIDNAEWIEPCGNSVLVLSNQGGNGTLLRYNYDASEPAAIESGDVLFPACSSDGSFIYYLNFHHSETLHRLSLQEGSSTNIADVLGDTPFSLIVVALSAMQNSFHGYINLSP